MWRFLITFFIKFLLNISLTHFFCLYSVKNKSYQISNFLLFALKFQRLNFKLAVFFNPWKLTLDVVPEVSNFFKQSLMLTLPIVVKLFDSIFSLSLIRERDFEPVLFESLFLIRSENSWQFLFYLFWVSIKTLYSRESLLFFIFYDPKSLLNDG